MGVGDGMDKKEIVLSERHNKEYPKDNLPPRQVRLSLVPRRHHTCIDTCEQ